MNCEIIKKIHIKKKLTAFTCDLEEDFGFRTGTMCWLEERSQMDDFFSLLKKKSVPITGFVVGRLLKNRRFTDMIAENFSGMEPHSYSHITNGTESEIKKDIEQSIITCARFFKKDPLGYRFPQGRFVYELIPFLKKLGIKYDSSVFPTMRPGVFNFAGMPQDPFYIDGLLELPLASFYKIRTIFSLSYLKLYGELITNLKMKLFGLPNVLIIDSHMTDIIDVKSIDLLPLPIRLAYKRNRGRGIELTEFLINLLQGLGYEFVTVRRIYDYCAKEND